MNQKIDVKSMMVTVYHYKCQHCDMENFDHDINKAICEIPHAKDCIWLGRNIKQTFNAIKKERMTYGEFLDKKESSKKTKG